MPEKTMHAPKHDIESQRLQSQKLEGIGQVAAAIAHDFNNILSVILNFSSFIADDASPGTQFSEDAGEIRKAAERGVALTRQLLIFSRKEVVKPEVLDINAVLKGVEKLIRSALGESVQFSMELMPDLSSVEMDPGQLEMVIMNIALNARDAMPKGGRFMVKSSNREIDETFTRSRLGMVPGYYVLMEFSDTGEGMSPETAERVFEPFFTTKPKGKGTGLGMSTVYGIIKRAHGNIWAYSEPGVGTVLKVYIPVAKRDADLRDAKTGRASPAQGNGQTVFVVEDEDSVRSAIRRVLASNGYRVLEAKNGAQALQYARSYNGPIDVLLTDVIMPELSGRDLAREVSALRPDIRVLYMSGYDHEVILHQGLLERDVVILQKPFNRDRILRKIRDMLVRR